MTNGPQPRVELVDEGNSRGDVQTDDVLIAHCVQILDEGAQAVPVRRDDDPSALADLGRDGLAPVGEKSRDGVLQGLGERQLGAGEAGIARVAARMAGVVAISALSSPCSAP